MDTEIDWNAYMQEAEGFLNGSRDYSVLKELHLVSYKAKTYPAGHEYVFSAFYFVTDRGRNLRFGQYIFAALYLLTLAIVFRIYDKCRAVPPYVLIFMCCTSYRIHSIYVLRMFNDPVAMALLYASVLLFLKQRWTYGCILYSLAVSVKMNVLLFAPALFVLLLVSVGYCRTFINICCCAFVQLLLGLPFLLTNPVSYVTRAFNFGRVFMHKWTVNWRFLPEEAFVNSWFHMILLAMHGSFLLWFAATKWLRYVRVCLCPIFRCNLSLHFAVIHYFFTFQEILFAMFTSNFIGIAFSRTLHYQFYVWYYHTLPFLFWKTSYSSVVRYKEFEATLVVICYKIVPVHQEVKHPFSPRLPIV
ncbi:unnamed protein product [Soboliphyme baturini]|uniref:dolichyl-P-Man:Man5GlcNAc2-PP-dolichol alpha-1,3-mannosyltransferase n=1 Tax=Soboliphyme baturini TaxID=241478 RepID=A0A183IDA6_9BILA|nr:unnamed protein product [Soboliphyme baturini]